VMYSRLFGKGQQNLYQFMDEELVDIDRKVLNGMAKGVKFTALAYHGVRMYSDAARFVSYKKTGQFMQATPFTGAKSVHAVLAEDAKFPASKEALISQEGWKVVDLTPDKRVRLADVLQNLPDKTFDNVEEVMNNLKVPA
jgi:hypothetical protein